MKQRLGGSVEKSLAGEAKLKPDAIFKEAWSKTARSISALFSGALFTIAVLLIAVSLVISFGFGGEVEATDPQLQGIIFLLNIVITTPLLAALHMMAINNIVGRKIAFNEAFQFIKQPFSLLLTVVITALISQLVAGVLGMLIGGLSFVAMIVLGVAFSMALPLTAEYPLRPLTAVQTSVQVMMKNFFPALLVYSVMVIAFIIAILPFGLGLIWVIPFYYNVKAVMYRELFGFAADNDLEQTTEPMGMAQRSSDNNDQNGSWSA